jgi:TIGR03009 family protein
MASQPPAAQPAAGQPAVGGQSAGVANPLAQGAAGDAGLAIPEANGQVNPVAPFPALSDQWQEYLDKVLNAWEKKSGQVERYACKFRRFQYDPTLVDTHAYTVAAGSVKYMKPDKGLFKVDQLVFYSGLDKDQKPQYKENSQKKFGEYWICDGKYVHILDQNEKKCTKYELPPNMRGNTIYLSPLPFLFGVKAEEIKSRYWVRPVVPPPDRKDEVWIEAYPRRADDAANYQRVQVVLDMKDWMPKGLIVFLPNWRANAQHRELYEFDDRQINASLLQRLFPQEFIPAEPPKDWKVIIEPYQDPQGPQSSEPRVAAPPTAPNHVR